MELFTSYLIINLVMVYGVSGSTLMTPPMSALVIAFEDVYDLSLLANTMSDQGIDVSIIVSSSSINHLYKNLLDVEVIHLKVPDEEDLGSIESQALRKCDALLTDQSIREKIEQIQPIFIVFPGLRHDGCLIPWTKHLQSIPVLYTRNQDEEMYVLQQTQFAIPIHHGSFWSKIWENFVWKSFFANVQRNFLNHALNLSEKLLPNVKINQDNLYSDVKLVLWGADTVLRTEFAPLTQSFIEIGCHHCRGANPLPLDLHKPLIEYRLGTVIVLLDDIHQALILDLAKKLPQGRQGQAMLWKTFQDKQRSWPDNIFLDRNVDRQDLIGYSRTRVVLSHCPDTEVLEAAFHGTPILCFPRDHLEKKNAARIIELGFGHSIETLTDPSSVEEIANSIAGIHNTGDYREHGRKISVFLRDRLNPASDRLHYWFIYLTKNRHDAKNIFLSRNKTEHAQSRPLNGDGDFFIGLLIGCLFGIMISGSAYTQRKVFFKNRRKDKSKGKYSR